MQTYDKLWKGIIEDLGEDFLHFFFQKIASKIDFDKGIEFLDQELAQLFPEADQNNRTIDKLVKVYLLTGKEEWILIHIEVQGYRDKTFGERMYTYYYRILDRYQKKIMSLAIFTDKEKNYKPSIYRSSYGGTTLTYKFRTYKVMEQSKEILSVSSNPFSLVVLATLEAIEQGISSVDDTNLMAIKWNIIRLLLERNYEKRKIIALFEFINHYIRFENSENTPIFAKQFFSIYQPNQKNMGVVDILIEDARQEGIEQGIEQGVSQGIEQGLTQKTIKVVENLITEFPEWGNEKIANLSATTLEFVVAIRERMNIK
jgi:predicted transposase YdaD